MVVLRLVDCCGVVCVVILVWGCLWLRCVGCDCLPFVGCVVGELILVVCRCLEFGLLRAGRVLWVIYCSVFCGCCLGGWVVYG